MSAEAENNLLLGPAHAARNGSEYRDPQVGGKVDHPVLTPMPAEEIAQPRKVWLPKTVEVDAGPAHAVVPPKRHAVALDQFQKTLKDGFFDGITGGIRGG